VTTFLTGQLDTQMQELLRTLERGDLTRLEELQALEYVREVLLADQRGPLRPGPGQYVMPFGKHVGATLYYLAEHEPQWFGWASKNLDGKVGEKIRAFNDSLKGKPLPMDEEHATAFKMLADSDINHGSKCELWRLYMADYYESNAASATEKLEVAIRDSKECQDELSTA